MLEITYNGTVIGRVETSLNEERPKYPVTVRHGSRPIFPAEEENEYDYYARGFALHGAGSILIHTAPSDLPGPRQEPADRVPTSSWTDSIQRWRSYSANGWQAKNSWPT